MRPGGAVAKAEGFLALLLIFMFVAFAYSFHGPRGITGDFEFEAIVLLLLYSGSWLFAIGGVRRGTGAGRIAAIVALGLLVTSGVLVLVTALSAVGAHPGGPE